MTAVEALRLFAAELGLLFAEMAPYLLLGFLLAGVLHVCVPRRLYLSRIGKADFRSCLWAALFGIPLPICSCGALPAAVALRREGASKGASVSFLVATPATGADSILATYSLLGLPFAILRPVAAFVTALVAGTATNLATRGELSSNNSTENPGECGCEGECGCSECGCDDCRRDEDDSPAGFLPGLKAILRYGLVDMVGNVAKWLAIGLALGALVAAFVPGDFFLALRDRPLLCMLAVLLLAMPTYTCATGSIPLALALVAKGITPGAALVLLMAGPATSVASMTVVGRAFGKRALFAYLASIAGGALFFGWIVDAFLMETFLSAMPLGSAACHAGHGAVGAFDCACAALLAGLMVYSRLPRKSEIAKEAAMVRTFVVKGMSCNHCKASVEKAARALPGVKAAEADVAKGTLAVEGEVDAEALRRAVEEAGFEFGGAL